MKIKRITILAIIIAINLVLSNFVRLPTPTGFVSLVEVGIFLAAWNFGPRSGAVVGGLTGLLLDLLAGYPQWMILSLIIHGTEGYIYGVSEATWLDRAKFTLVGGIVMVVGYWLGGAALNWLMGGMNMQIMAALGASASEIPANVMQVLVGFVVALIVNKPVNKLLTSVEND
ncbi:putative membrane protein [Weissella uvarum]|uniref:ECF transporter S component n=1 Tax=Weissella uvarum TaxID=1479233 RepID=UPI0019602540|nr:ECF transporter S component [Weissella uvarum]MBM7617058.1 putative membrane protein [Weissella uvarum]MCM0595356.1 ECF transporter S component [Weissella uvarum]